MRLTDLNQKRCALPAMSVVLSVIGCGQSSSSIGRSEWTKVARFGTTKAKVVRVLGPPRRTAVGSDLHQVAECLFYSGDRTLGPPGTEVEFCFDGSNRLTERVTRYPNQDD